MKIYQRESYSRDIILRKLSGLRSAIKMVNLLHNYLPRNHCLENDDG